MEASVRPVCPVEPGLTSWGEISRLGAGRLTPEERRGQKGDFYVMYIYLTIFFVFCGFFFDIHTYYMMPAHSNKHDIKNIKKNDSPDPERGLGGWV